MVQSVPNMCVPTMVQSVTNKYMFVPTMVQSVPNMCVATMVQSVTNMFMVYLPWFRV